MRDAQGTIGLNERERHIHVSKMEKQTAESKRHQRMAWLVKMLKSAEPPISVKKFVAIGAYNQGVSVTKIREYLDLLIDMEVLEEDEEELKWLG